MKDLGYYNGKYGSLEEMTIPMNDRASWFGDGVYDAGCSHNYHLFAIDEHIDRFFSSAAALDINIPLSKSELKDLLNDLMKKMDAGDLLVYFQVTRGTAVRNHTYDEGSVGNLWVTITPEKINTDIAPARLITEEDTRFFHCNIKTLNLLPSVMASQKAKRAGCMESVLYRPGGRVTECAHSNVHILKDGILRTAPLDNLILPGIARAHLIKACKELDIPVIEEAFTLEDLFDADEILVTSSGGLCIHAGVIDNKPVGCKDDTRYMRIRSALLNEFYSECGDETRF